MCCCGQPIINGQFGYKWQPSDPPSVRRADPPELRESEVLIFDEPGRCGGTDSHSHHYRVVKEYSSLWLLVRNGGGDKRFRLSLDPSQRGILEMLDSNGRYWMLNAIHHAWSDARREAAAEADRYWRLAAAEKRIKTRKLPSRGTVKVWIEPEAAKDEPSVEELSR